MKSKKAPDLLKLPFTGERYVPELRGTIALEHLHRYAYACQFVKNRVVLDIACGEGYGSEMLARTARKVYGVDIDKTTIAHAKRKYKSRKLKFVEGGCESIPLRDGSVDVVVSFETIEHTSKHNQILSEIKRVLRPGGLLIISSPEKTSYGSSRSEENPYHRKELDRRAFEKLLSAHFRNTQIVGQTALLGSFITSSAEPLPFGPRFEFSKLPRNSAAAKGLPEPIYLIAFCADGDLPPVFGSFCRQLVSESEDYQQLADTVSSERAKLEARVGERTEWAKRLEAELAGARRVQAEAVKDAEEKVKWAKSLEAELGKLRAAFAQEQKTAVERTEWAKRLEVELAGARRVQGEAVKDAEEKVEWARGLEKELVAAQRAVEQAQGDAQEKVKWAKSLETELGKLREAFAQEQKTAVERTEWAKKLEVELAGARRVQGEAVKDAEEKVEWARGLEKELVAAQRAVEQAQGDAQEKVKWAKSLEAELAGAIEENVLGRQKVEILGKEIGALSQSLADEKQLVSERTAWAQSLEKDVESARDAHNRAAQESERLRAELREVLESSCWRITSPLRWVVLSARRLMERIRRTPQTLKLLCIDRQKAFFDATWYLEQYPDVREKGKRPFVHYALHGFFEGRMPNASQQSRSLGTSDGYIRPWLLSEYINVFQTRLISPQRAKTSIKTALRLLRTQGFAGLKRGIETARLLQPPKAFRSGPLQISLPQSTGDLPHTQLPYFPEPLVSVIIAVYNNVEFTANCIDSISKSGIQAAYEVIVADDGSTDQTKDWCRSVPNLRHVITGSQRGFVLNNNAGAAVAKGKYLLFLNNDTLVRPGWLDELLATFQNFPKTGLVGSKLVYPDGRLQEAGAIIWQDGSAWNFGRNQDPSAPEYNYAREVDYCSAASVMIPRHLFEQLGGFDEMYVPAYCEDYDLALKLKSKGWRIIYQPRSEVVHFEGASNGTTEEQGLKAFQARNMEKAFDRWKDYLRTYQQNGEDVDAAKDRAAVGRVLFLDQCTPTPDQDSGSIDAINSMILLREFGLQTTFIPTSNFCNFPKYTPLIQSLGVEALYAPYVTSVEQHVERCGHRYDLIIASRYNTLLPVLSPLKKFCPRAKILFNTVDLHFLRIQRQAKLMDDAMVMREAEETKRWELNLIDAADITTVVSPVELEVLKSEKRANKVRVVPYSRRIETNVPPFRQRRDLVFIGGYQHPPNEDAAIYFVSEIMPQIQRQLPDVVCHLVGSNVTNRINALKSKTVVVHGYVEDLDSLLDRMRVAIAPLRFGAGIKGKIGSAMSRGLPTVATPIAAEGMGIRHENEVLIAESSHQFAQQVVRIYNDDQLWLKLSQAGLDFAKTKWGVGAASGHLRALLDELMVPCRIPSLVPDLY